jgi:hypothetical protein
MKKFLQEVLTYFWIPLIVGLVSYIFFQLKDVLLGIMTLVALSAIYTIVRLYFAHRKWWLFIILVVVVFGSIGLYFIRAPAITLTVNGQRVTGASVALSQGSVTINPVPQSNGLYTKNTVITLTANPNEGYDWKSWAGSDNDTANPTKVTMGKDKQVIVKFESRFSLIINNQLVIGSLVSFAEGSVNVTPAPEGDGKYASGTEITLNARAGTGYDWTGWSGTANDGINPTKLTMSGNKHITVMFDQRFSLTIGSQPVIGGAVSFPEGSVTVSPAPGADDKYASGTKVTLTANPATGYGWKYWSGTGSDTTNPTTITINSNKMVAVTFEQRYLLAVNSQPLTGPSLDLTGGAVTAEPAPGSDGRYTKDSVTTLTAVPAAGYRFDGWGGDVTGEASSINVTMNVNKSITAAFVKIYTLNVTNNPVAGGSVSPAGGVYDEGSGVSLTATAAAGYRFDRWSGDASGNVTSVDIAMNADKNITAEYIKVYTLTITLSPAEGGTVSPTGGVYDTGAEISITATPSTGYVFDHWEGDVIGTDATITITMNGDKSVKAVFAAAP